jgi:hypothetical protein
MVWSGNGQISKPVRQFQICRKVSGFNSDFSGRFSRYSNFLEEKYKKKSTYIAYGAHPFTSPDESIILICFKVYYNMIMARFEPENNLDMVLEGVVLSNNNMEIIVVGNHETKYGEYLKINLRKKILDFRWDFNLEHLNSLRYSIYISMVIQ